MAFFQVDETERVTQLGIFGLALQGGRHDLQRIVALAAAQGQHAVDRGKLRMLGHDRGGSVG